MSSWFSPLPYFVFLFPANDVNIWLKYGACYQDISESRIGKGIIVA